MARFAGSRANAAVLVFTAELAVITATVVTLRPTEALLFALLAIAGAILLWRTDLALLFVVAMGPLELAYNVSFGPLTLTKIAGAVCVASFLLTAVRSRRPLVADTSQVLVLVILVFATVSTLQALELGEAMTTTLRYASFVAVFFVVTQIGTDEKIRRRIAWTISAGAAILAIVGLNAYFTGASYVASPSQSNPNDYGFSLATALPFAFWLLRTKASWRPLVLAMIGVMCTGILMSLSRGTFVGLGAAVVFLLLTERRRFRLIALGGLVAVVAAIVVIQVDPARFEQAVFAKQHVAQENVATRLQAWDAAGALAADHPLLGIGPGNFRFYYYSATQSPPGTTNLFVVHDAYMDIAVELGFGAALAFLIYLARSFELLNKIVGARGPNATYAQTVRVALVIASTSAFFLSEQYFLPFWLLGGLAVAMWHEQKQEHGLTSIRAG
jgi:O-antigen ligase